MGKIDPPREPPFRLDVRALCGLDSALLDRVQQSRDLGRIAGRAAAVVAVGGGVYGFAFGVWRSVEQGIYSALKLPLLLFAVVACCAVINGFLAQLLRAPVGIVKGLVSILLALAVAAALLGALAPVSLYLALAVPGPTGAGFASSAVAGADSFMLQRTAQYVLLYHIVIIGAAGVVGNLRLYRLLCRLTDSKAIASRVLWSWMAVDALVGTQLSWILRPYLCKPALPAALLRPDAFQGNFFEELWRILSPLVM